MLKYSYSVSFMRVICNQVVYNRFQFPGDTLPNQIFSNLTKLLSLYFIAEAAIPFVHIQIPCLLTIIHNGKPI